MRVDVLHFPTPAAAIAAANHGDEIYFPAVKSYLAPSGGWQITKSLTIRGDGDGSADTGPTLQPFDANSPVFSIIPPVENVHIHDLHLRWPGSGSGTGVGILARSTAANPTVISDLRLARLRISGFPSHGIHIEGYASSETPPSTILRVERVSIEDCTVRACGGAGLFLSKATEVRMAGCAFELNGTNGLRVDGSVLGQAGFALADFAAYQCRFDGNTLEDAKLTRCAMVRLDALRFVNVDGGSVKKACVMEGCDAGVLGPCYFAAASVTGTEGIVLTANDPAGSNVPCGPIAILPGRFKNIATMICVDAGSRDCVLLPQYDETGNGSISLPSGANEGMFGAAHVARSASNLLTGLIVPSSANDPTASLRPGMLAYKTGVGLRVNLDGTTSGWKTVVLDPP